MFLHLNIKLNAESKQQDRHFKNVLIAIYKKNLTKFSECFRRHPGNFSKYSAGEQRTNSVSWSQ